MKKTRDMPNTILHVSDLHLSVGELEYSLRVLGEIVETANARRVDYLLLSGDVFESMPDVEALREAFREAISETNAEVLYLPGNHEELDAGRHRLDSFDFGKARLLHTQPWGLVCLGDGDKQVEILSIPHQADYSGYCDWKIPPKQTPYRIAMAHGVVTGMTYTGPDAEAGGSALDPDVFERFGVDYAALGHIHSRPADLRKGNCLIAYSGSARVWRSGERSERGGILVTLGEGVSTVFVPFKSAGQYRLFRVPLKLDGSTGEMAFEGDLQPNDYVHIRLEGLVEDENRVREIADGIRRGLEGKARKIEIDTSEITVLDGIASEPSAVGFIELWEAKKPDESDPEYQIWLRARAMGLEYLKSRLEEAS